MKLVHTSKNVHKTVTRLKSATLKVVDNIVHATSQITEAPNQKIDCLIDVDTIIARHTLRQLGLYGDER